jgi:hypothetical protein
VLFQEREFQAACDIARWQTFPLGLAMVGELAEGLLTPAWPDNRVALNAAVRALVLKIFDRYPVPSALGASRWAQLREELDRHLMQMSLHPPKWAKDIPEPFWQRYFDLMPIHERMRTKDEFTTRNYLRVTLIGIHDELTKRIAVDAVVADLVARG